MTVHHEDQFHTLQSWDSHKAFAQSKYVDIWFENGDAFRVGRYTLIAADIFTFEDGTYTYLIEYLSDRRGLRIHDQELALYAKCYL